MNVSTFESNPDLKWWFIVSVPVLVVVLVLWYGVKHNLASQRQNPMRRGVYESLYHELATDHSTLWTRGGPREDVIPVGWWAGVKWRLLTSWFGGDKLKLGKDYNPAMEEFGTWSRTKRYLARRWLGELAVMPLPQSNPSRSGASSNASSHSLDKELGAVGELLNFATPVAVAELNPKTASQLQQRVPVERLRSLSPKGERSVSRGSRTSSDGGVMVEEERAVEIEMERVPRLDVPR